MKKSLAFLYFLFWIILALDCYLMQAGYQENRLFTKTLLVPILLIAIFVETSHTNHKRSKILANLALTFCFLGDFFLLNDSNPNYFIVGLASFLIGHLCFIVFFYRLKQYKPKYSNFLLVTSLGVFSYVALLITILWSSIDAQHLALPVTLYAFVLGLMLLSAIYSIKNRSIKKLATNHFIPGAVFFVISDSLLAINKFLLPIDYAGLAVMITYGLAIFLLSTGIIRFLRK